MILLTRLCLLGLLACGLASADYYNIKTADNEFALRQKKIYNLLYHVGQPDIVNRPLYDEGQEWSIEANINSYANTLAVKDFLYMYKNGMLPRGELFSTYYSKMLKEMKALFRLFYYANDFDVFYKTALWARNNINEGQFFLALYNAVIRRPDTVYIQLPPPSEMYPYFFFNSEVLEKAHHPKVFGKLDPQAPEGFKSYIISANYSGWYVNREFNLENRLNYFTEDVGLNSYYFFFRHGFPFWMESKEFNLPDYRGEEYLYGHKQLMNRYYLERLSNDLPKLEDFDWQQPFYAGYYPTMTYHNGLPFPQRPDWVKLPIYKYKYIKDIMDKESRITAAIDSGYILNNDSKWYNIYNETGVNVLGNIIEGNADSPNRQFYGSIDALGRNILGYNLEPANKYQILPSALETFSTSMRDPAFYRLYRRICSFYYRYKMKQKPYIRDEIMYPNLKIESFTVDKMTTFFEYFDTSIGNSLLVENQKEADSLLIKIRQDRLNNNAFNFHIALNSDKPMKAAIRIFLGPKYDSHRKLIELPENLKYFYEIDNWIIDVNAGLNKIVRNSRDCFFLMPDQEPNEIFYKKLLKNLEGNSEFTYSERIFGFPERLLLPKGKKEGMPFQLFLHVSPVTSMNKYNSRIWGNYKFDNRPFGFPLDKPLDGFNYDGPNMMFKDILIYHKDQPDMNIPY
ncbi:Hexamerin [Habropoda laboriosa]|uniref:Hexamerin n=1 Tax=Habropoda laboriosa TaxID=597456 RepID=A0A0L7REA9_9HYME|nr:PREDICTED: arylphorin subunit alpha-like [Habropoda laboriosa]KOC69159.1 Hexamerin [Habropoda laboriosa]